MKTIKIIIITLLIAIIATWTYTLIKCFEEYPGVF